MYNAQVNPQQPPTEVLFSHLTPQKHPDPWRQILVSAEPRGTVNTVPGQSAKEFGWTYIQLGRPLSVASPTLVMLVDRCGSPLGISSLGLLSELPPRGCAGTRPNIRRNSSFSFSNRANSISLSKARSDAVDVIHGSRLSSWTEGGLGESRSSPWNERRH